MTKLIFYTGLRQIGGTVVAVETDRAVCLFDFGFSVNDRTDSAIRLRPGRIPQDYVRTGMLPLLDGIYGPSTARDLGCQPYDENGRPLFFLLSHMHIDHMGGLEMLDPKVPVYMSGDSLTLYQHLALQGELIFRSHKNAIGLPYGTNFEVEDIRVRILQIDHDCTGACGYLIQTPDGTICYTGDYRFHGLHPEVSAAFAKACRGADVLITEGTTVSFEEMDIRSLTAPPDDIRTEEDLLLETAETVRKAAGLVVINPYNRNVERVHRLGETLRAADRTLVLDNAQADYLSAFYPEDPVCVYKETLRNRPAPKGGVFVDRTQLLSSPGRYVLQLDYTDQYELFDLAPVTDEYLHMDGAPLGSYDPSYGKMIRQLEALGIRYRYLSLGGHAYPYYIRYMVDTIAPGTLIPLHSEHPERVDSAKAGQRILPEEGECLIMEKGQVRRGGIC